jgi:hypothetical protein
MTCEYLARWSDLQRGGDHERSDDGGNDAELTHEPR